jgi:hypothetical protein
MGVHLQAGDTPSTPSRSAENHYNSLSQLAFTMSDHQKHQVRSVVGNTIPTFLLGMVFAALLGAIGVGLFIYFNPRNPVATAPATSPTGQPTPQAATETTTSETSPASPGDSAPVPVGASDLPPAQTLNQQINHANGTTARLTQMVFNEDSIVATLTITNGYKREIRLNSNNDMVILDSLGNQYNLAAPPNNEDIRIAAGTTLKGQFVFKGRLAPGTTAITLATNNKFGGSEDYSSRPKMSFNVPLPGGTQ